LRQEEGRTLSRYSAGCRSNRFETRNRNDADPRPQLFGRRERQGQLAARREQDVRESSGLPGRHIASLESSHPPFRRWNFVQVGHRLPGEREERRPSVRSMAAANAPAVSSRSAGRITSKPGISRRADTVSTG